MGILTFHLRYNTPGGISVTRLSSSSYMYHFLHLSTMLKLNEIIESFISPFRAGFTCISSRRMQLSHFQYLNVAKKWTLSYMIYRDLQEYTLYHMEPFEPKWVNPVLNIIWVNSYQVNYCRDRTLLNLA